MARFKSMDYWLPTMGSVVVVLRYEVPEPTGPFISWSHKALLDFILHAGSSPGVLRQTFHLTGQRASSLYRVLSFYTLPWGDGARMAPVALAIDPICMFTYRSSVRFTTDRAAFRSTRRAYRTNWWLIVHQSSGHDINSVKYIIHCSISSFCYYTWYMEINNSWYSDKKSVA